MSDRCITSEKLLAIAEARIAELEAENKAYFVALEGAKAAIIDLSQRAEQAEANWRTQKAATDAMQLDRARIAELQAELAALQTEHNAVAAKYKQKWQQAEAELAALKSAELSEHRLAREEAEAELAAVKGRRCETCKCVREDKGEWHECLIYFEHVRGWEHMDDFACNRWTARAEEGSEE